jgi:hypothetical protein
MVLGIGGPTDHYGTPKTNRSVVKTSPHTMVSGVGGVEELQLQSQEGQELSATSSSREQTLKMSSEDQTVDHTNMLMGNDHYTIFV